VVNKRFIAGLARRRRVRSEKLNLEGDETRPAPPDVALRALMDIRARRARAALAGGDYYGAGRDTTKSVRDALVCLLADVQWMLLEQPKWRLQSIGVVGVAEEAVEMFEAEKAHEMLRAQIGGSE
jgi:hypothetical protein